MLFASNTNTGLSRFNNLIIIKGVSSEKVRLRAYERAYIAEDRASNSYGNRGISCVYVRTRGPVK